MATLVSWVKQDPERAMSVIDFVVLKDYIITRAQARKKFFLTEDASANIAQSLLKLINDDERVNEAIVDEEIMSQQLGPYNAASWANSLCTKTFVEKKYSDCIKTNCKTDREANPAVAFLKKRKSYCDALKSGTKGKPAKTGVTSKTHTAKAGKTVAHPKKTNTAAKVKPSKTGVKGKPTKTATKKANSTAKPPTKKQYQNLIAKLPICSFGCISKQLGSFDYATLSNSVCKAGFDNLASSCVKANCKAQNDVKSASNFLMARKGYCFFASVMGKDGKQGGSNATAGITRLQDDVTKTTKAVLVAQPTATQIVKDAAQLNSEVADKNQDATATEVEEAEDEEDADGGDNDDEDDGDNDADEDDTDDDTDNEEDSEDNAEGEEDNTNEEADEYLPTAEATAESLGAARNVIPNDIKSRSGSVILSVGILSFTIIFMSL
ncbi:hypothetical protein HDU99_004128 [Rhizoclosmatium hyalinum]|nr:hypothetical protein HDU99_004128 [Rhizoclosmatium hyalinum]